MRVERKGTLAEIVRGDSMEKGKKYDLFGVWAPVPEFS